MSTTTTPGGSPQTGSAGTTDKLEGAARDAEQAARDSASKIAEQGQQAYRQGTASVKDAALSAASSVRAEASNLAEGAAEKAKSLAEEQKNAGAERLSSVASAVSRAADDLEEASPGTARLIREAATRVNDFSAEIQGRSVEDLLDSARYYARQQPLAVFGGAVVAGLLLSRFLKSTAESAPQSPYRGGRNVPAPVYGNTAIGTPRRDVVNPDRDWSTGDRVDPVTGDDPLSAAQPQPENFSTVSGGTRNGI